jgi:kinetochore protein Nuf2
LLACLRVRFNMMRKYQFRILPAKDLAQLLQKIGATGATPELIEKPSCEAAVNWLQHVTEFAYGLEVQQLKAQLIKPQLVHQLHSAAEIYDEVIDTVIIFKLAQQLAYINGVEDFSWRDLWEPQTKKFKAILSGLINFCRYKDQQTAVITDLKTEVQALDTARLELVEVNQQREQELTGARSQHSEELPAMFEAEQKAQEARNLNDRLQKQRQIADRVVEEAESRLRTCKERAADNQQRTSQLREEQGQLRDQVAESPEGLEQEIQELRVLLGSKRAFVEDKDDEKRQRAVRDHALTKVQDNLVALAEALDKATAAANRAQAAREKTRREQEELADLRRAAESQAAETAELEDQVRALQADIERGEQVHLEKEQALNARRQVALQKHEELQAKRTDEERAYHTLQQQRLELEVELKQERRKHQAQCAELQRHRQNSQHEREAYAQSVDQLLMQSCHGGDALLSSYPHQGSADGLKSSAPRQSLKSPVGKRLRSPAARSPGRQAIAGFKSPLGRLLMSPEA